MAGGGGGGDGLRSLEETPTWAVAVVCFVLVLISIFIEQLIHLLGKFLMKRHKKALYEALEKVKSELMLLGFISLLLTVGQSAISEICVSQSVGDSWHPCKPKKYGGDNPSPEESKSDSDDPSGSHGRKLLEIDGAGMALRRVLAGGGGGVDKCAEKGKVPLISTDGINQLHIFIFVLAVFHVIYCITTMILGRLKMRKWKNWERETKTVEYQFTHDPERFRFARETSFGRRHLSFWSKSPVLIWIVCFFRQFIPSVSKVDYLTLRHGFVMAHLAPQNSMNFDFQKYITRSLDEEFQVVVGISPLIWFFAVLFLLFNTHGWYSYYWLPFVPLIIILLVGTKLQVIITRMALRIMERGDVVKGVPVVQPADNLFWFNRPRLLLNLIHFVLFQNAFQVAFFVWSWYEFGIKSCFHEETEDIIIRISMGVLIHIVCSYVTLPLYALVTQMGSNMKPVIFNERVATALKQWHNTARKNVKENRKSGTVTPITSRPPTPPSRLSPVHLLHNYRGEIEIDIDSHHNSPKKYNLDFERFDADGSAYTTEGSSSHHHGKNILQENRGGLEMQVADGSYASPANFTVPVLEEDPSNVDINFSFDKRLHRVT